MDTPRLISTGKKTALISFIGGTFIIILLYFSNDVIFGVLGLGYTVIMLIINIIVLVRLSNQANKDKINRDNIFKIVRLMFLNIPIAILYFWVAIVLLNTVRITFINSTQTEIEDVKIKGCEEKYIQKLSPGQSKTVWVNIPNDCGVSIVYKIDGQMKEENVTGYVTNEGGYIMSFKIGTNQKIDY